LKVIVVYQRLRQREVPGAHGRGAEVEVPVAHRQSIEKSVLLDAPARLQQIRHCVLVTIVKQVPAASGLEKEAELGFVTVIIVRDGSEYGAGARKISGIHERVGKLCLGRHQEQPPARPVGVDRLLGVGNRIGNAPGKSQGIRPVVRRRREPVDQTARPRILDRPIADRDRGL
jgi:hypothetical protein